MKNIFHNLNKLQNNDKNDICPDLTKQWLIVVQKWENGKINDFELKVLLDSLDLLNRKGIISLNYNN